MPWRPRKASLEHYVFDTLQSFGGNLKEMNSTFSSPGKNAEPSPWNRRPLTHAPRRLVHISSPGFLCFSVIYWFNLWIVLVIFYQGYSTFPPSRGHLENRNRGKVERESRWQCKAFPLWPARLGDWIQFLRWALGVLSQHIFSLSRSLFLSFSLYLSLSLSRHRKTRPQGEKSIDM